MRKIAFLISCLMLLSSSGFARKSKLNTDQICTTHLSNNLMFFDYKDYLLITNHVTNQQYVYWKKLRQLQAVPIDSAVLWDIYANYLHDPAQYSEFMRKGKKSAEFRPRIESLCAYDKSTVLGCLVVIHRDTAVEGKDTVINFNQMPSILTIRSDKPVSVSFIDKAEPIPHHDISSDILSYKKKVYMTLSAYIEDSDINYNELHDLARLKKQGSIYTADKIMPTVINDYLVTNKVFHNYNRIYFDNGYSLMSLSNYIFNLDTEEKIYLPIADSVFRKLHIDPKTFGIEYYVADFKYNKAERKFYIHYSLGDDDYVASFRPHAKAFETNVRMYAYDSEFGKQVKNSCLSWDGKQIVYSLKGEDCFYYVSPAGLQEIAKNYKQRN